MMLMTRGVVPRRGGGPPAGAIGSERYPPALRNGASAVPHLAWACVCEHG
jgi:hypothetical protein